MFLSIDTNHSHTVRWIFQCLYSWMVFGLPALTWSRLFLVCNHAYFMAHLHYLSLYWPLLGHIRVVYTCFILLWVNAYMCSVITFIINIPVITVVLHKSSLVHVHVQIWIVWNCMVFCWMKVPEGDWFLCSGPSNLVSKVLLSSMVYVWFVSCSTWLPFPF